MHFDFGPDFPSSRSSNFYTLQEGQKGRACAEAASDPPLNLPYPGIARVPSGVPSSQPWRPPRSQHGCVCSQGPGPCVPSPPPCLRPLLPGHQAHVSVCCVASGLWGRREGGISHPRCSLRWLSQFCTAIEG